VLFAYQRSCSVDRKRASLENEMLIIHLNRTLLPVKHNAYNQRKNVSSDFIYYIIQRLKIQSASGKSGKHEMKCRWKSCGQR